MHDFFHENGEYFNNKRWKVPFVARVAPVQFPSGLSLRLPLRKFYANTNINVNHNQCLPNNKNNSRRFNCLTCSLKKLAGIVCRGKKKLLKNRKGKGKKHIKIKGRGWVLKTL